MEQLHHNSNISIEYLQGLMADLILSQKETDKKFIETDKKFIETDKQFKETDKRLSEKFEETDKKFRAIHEELGGIGKSNGEIAENFFATALKNDMQIGKLKFDYIDLNVTRKKNQTEAEYDIILYNDHKVLVVEIKYNFRIDHLHRFYKNSLKKFRSLFPHYKDFKLYGAIAALSFEKGVIQEAENYGFHILTQNSDKLKLNNTKNFEPSEIK